MNVPTPQFIPPKPSAQHIETLVTYLRGQPTWMTAEQIGFALGWGDRKVRRVASACDEIVSHPGSEGYKLEEKSSEDEFSHFGNSLRAQARAMIGRWLRVRNKRRQRQRDQGLLPL